MKARVLLGGALGGAVFGPTLVKQTKKTAGDTKKMAKDLEPILASILAQRIEKTASPSALSDEDIFATLFLEKVAKGSAKGFFHALTGGDVKELRNARDVAEEMLEAARNNEGPVPEGVWDRIKHKFGVGRAKDLQRAEDRAQEAGEELLREKDRVRSARVKAALGIGAAGAGGGYLTLRARKKRRQMAREYGV